MKRVHFACIALLLTLVQVSALAQVSAVPPLINFQGRLAKPDGTPVANGTYSIKFTLFTAATGGTQKWTETDTVAVKNGVFAAQLGKATALSGALFASSLWLEVKVGTDAALTPRQPLVTVAYAFKADTVPDASIGATQLANGAVTSAKLASGILNPLAWLLGGNSGTTSSSFLGTKDNRPLEMRVNNHRAMQYTYIEDTSNPGNEFRTLNVLGGSEINTISPGVFGATIVGGGQDYFTGTDYPNTVTDNFGTVVGGSLNTANGFSFVGGGYNNKATEFYSTIVGGTFNIASNNQTFIGGGILNTASGFGAVVPGGEGNTASGNFSLAAGNGANALHDGCFVWSDNAQSPIFTTGSNQFLVRAVGGVKLHQNTTLEFGFGYTGKEVDAGVMGYEIFSPDALDIVGAGTPNVRKITLWTEGGLTSTGSVFAPSFANISDARYKTHILPLANALDAVLNLRGVTFDWNREAWKEKHFREGRQIGFIAQEVEKVLPELVSTDAQGYRSVAYANVVPVLVEAMKQQQAQISAQQTQIEELSALRAQVKEMDTLRAQLSALTVRLTQMETERDIRK